MVEGVLSKLMLCSSFSNPLNFASSVCCFWGDWTLAGSAVLLSECTRAAGKGGLTCDVSGNCR